MLRDEVCRVRRGGRARSRSSGTVAEAPSPLDVREAGVPRLILDRIRQGLCVFDGAECLVLFNRRFAEIYNLDPADLSPGMSLRDIVDLRLAAGTGPTMSAEHYARWRRDVARKNATSETIVHLRDGRIVEIHHKPMPDGGWVATHDDITERLRAETRLAASEARLRALTDALPQMVWLTGESSEATYRNAQFDAYYGPIGPGLAERVGRNHPDDAEHMRHARDTALSTGKALDVEGRLRRRDGVYRWHRLVMVPVRLDGEITEWLGTALDIDDTVTAREARRVSEERLALALDAGSDGLWDCDVKTGSIWFSDRWKAMLGYGPNELPGHMRGWMGLLHLEDRRAAMRALRDHLLGRTSIFEHEHRLLRRDGGWVWVHTRGKVVARDEGGHALRVVGTDSDINARKLAESRIAHMAGHDSLTDLPNRAMFRKRLGQRLDEVARQGGVCAVLCLDLDRFKVINDTLGHLAGDVLLKEVAVRLKAAIGETDMLARLGGDEFAVLANGGAGPASAAVLAKALIAAIEEPLSYGEHQLDVGVSIGIATAPADGADAETILRRADLALYRAKAHGRNTYRRFERAMDEEVAARRRLELELRHAIGRGETILHYQPIVRSRTGECIAFEALARWRHPERGLVPPQAFIPLAEETGLIVPLGEWVLRSACREAARWPKHLSVAVNLSPKQFQQADLPTIVLEILNETGLSPSRLELEITESLIINDMSRALAALRRLKALGIRIAMDDFGTGYSSLATLQSFPFDKIKIDRSFVAQIEKNPQAAVIVQTVVGLGRRLGMSVVAEGVETTDQRSFLVAEDCDEMQGYLFGKPGPIEMYRVRDGGLVFGPSKPKSRIARRAQV